MIQHCDQYLRKLRFKSKPFFKTTKGRLLLDISMTLNM